MELAARKGEQIPDGWGVDKDGKMTNKPEECVHKGLNLISFFDELNSLYYSVRLS